MVPWIVSPYSQSDGDVSSDPAYETQQAGTGGRLVQGSRGHGDRFQVLLSVGVLHRGTPVGSIVDGECRPAPGPRLGAVGVEGSPPRAVGQRDGLGAQSPAADGHGDPGRLPRAAVDAGVEGAEGVPAPVAEIFPTGTSAALGTRSLAVPETFGVTRNMPCQVSHIVLARPRAASSPEPTT